MSGWARVRWPVAAAASIAAVLLAACSTPTPGAQQPEPSSLPGLAPTCTEPDPDIDPGTGDVAPAEHVAAVTDLGLWSPTWEDPPGAGALSFPAQPLPGMSPDALMWKQVVMLDSGVSGTLTIVSPDSASFIVSTFEEWVALDADIVEGRLARSVELSSCADTFGVYPGAVVLEAPSCVTFRIEVGGRPERSIAVPFFGASCPDRENSAEQPASPSPGAGVGVACHRG